MTKKTQPILAIKGFDRDLKCRGFQFEIGKTYKHEGPVVRCTEAGFHSIEGHPLEVFSYYAPGTSRYALVEASGEIARDKSDSKIASAEITIKAEIHLHELIERAVEYVMDRAKKSRLRHATKAQGAASATGDQGAASATGVRGAASATGARGAASATGWQGAASATGVRGAASATGVQGAASATGDHGAAMACGYGGSVSGANGNALFLVERNNNHNIIAVWAGIVGKKGIKENVWYTLRGGKPVRAKGDVK